MRQRAAAAARPEGAPTRSEERRASGRPRLRRVPDARSPRRGRLPGRGALLLIPLIAVLLAGVVWINVAKLNVTAETGSVLERSRAVQSDNVRLQGQLEQRNSQVIDDAERRLGMVPARNDRIIRVTAPALPGP